MVTCPSIRKDVIRGHYDLTTVFYRLLWGPHIHHGLWCGDESPSAAQLQLTETLADLADVKEGEEIVDVGCGMGGSTIHLARTRSCRVTGVTISPVQRTWASMASRWHGVANRTTFRCEDAETCQFPPQSVDVVWSIECTEHLFEKAAFFRKAAGWLKPGGRMAICAWLAGDELDESRTRQVTEVCEGFFCPSLGTRGDYATWMQDAGLELERADDWTNRVTRTWEICSHRVNRWGMRRVARLLDRNSVLFLDRFDVILAAYRSGAMAYGCFVARNPSPHDGWARRLR